jgi:hypothetical protein
MDTLELLKSFIAPGGRLLLTVPLEGHLLKLTSSEMDQDHHLFCWNPTTMRNLLEICGYTFKNVTVRSAAAEHRLESLALFSWVLFKLSVRVAGVLLRRREMTVIAAPRCGGLKLTPDNASYKYMFRDQHDEDLRK